MGCERQLNMTNFVIQMFENHEDQKNEENKEDLCAGESNHCRCRLIDLFAFDCPLYNQLYKPASAHLLFCIFVFFVFL